MLQKILIPKDVEVPTNQITYIVKSGDSLYAIANKYGIKIEEVMAIGDQNNDIEMVVLAFKENREQLFQQRKSKGKW